MGSFIVIYCLSEDKIGTRHDTGRNVLRRLLGIQIKILSGGGSRAVHLVHQDAVLLVNLSLFNSFVLRSTVLEPNLEEGFN